MSRVGSRGCYHQLMDYMRRAGEAPRGGSGIGTPSEGCGEV